MFWGKRDLLDPDFSIKTVFRSILITRLGVNWVKPWNSVKINLGLKGPDIRPGLDNKSY